MARVIARQCTKCKQIGLRTDVTCFFCDAPMRDIYSDKDLK